MTSVKQGKLSTNTHALIGAGNMGGALLNGWLRDQSGYALNASQILVIDPAPGEAAARALRVGVKFSAQLTKGAASGLKLCLLAVKPQKFNDIASALATALPKDTLIVSIMAGINLQKLHDVFGGRPIVRAMPNLPAAFGAGITAYVCGIGVNDVHRSLVSRSLEPTGVVVEVQSENEIDMVTAISGSGPGYVFYLTELLAQAGVDLGLSPELAAQLARQTVIGSGAVLARSRETASTWRKNVTSPRGTTEAALDVLRSKKGLPDVMERAVKAAYKRSQELGKA